MKTITECVQLPIKTGEEANFEAAMRRGTEILRAAEGCLAVSLQRGIENPSKYLLQLQWTSVDAHTAFTGTPAFQTFRELVGSFYAERPTMEHFSPL